MLRVWLKHCEFSHTKCAIGDFHSYPLDGKCPLPLRVIDVGPSNGSTQPRLCFPDGLQGKWIALSHCWGNKLLQPPKTTRKNLRKHEKRIPLESLPRTFHDAVLVTRALEIRYLWIDSLCIVQDDAADVAEQLPRMGEIYRNASLTLLAGESTNCGDGLFFDVTALPHTLLRSARDSSSYDLLENSSTPNIQDNVGLSQEPQEDQNAVTTPVEVPFYRSGKVEGTFFATPIEESDPYGENRRQSFGGIPLFQRGWVTQEWAFSRRSILFLRDEIVWSCRESCENDQGTKLQLARPDVLDWYELIQEYSMKGLTYEGDRLRAVAGLAHSLRACRSDEYFAGH